MNAATNHSTSTFGRYELIAKIGEGGTGQVFLARARGEAGFERLFALKLIPRRAREERAVDAFMQEAKIASKVQHRNVVSIVDVGQYNDGQYLVMEYVEGCTLSELQIRHRDLRPPRLIVPIVLDALFGLHAAHTLKDEHDQQLHLVHRDISPQNLLIGIDGACRVTDFGIALARGNVQITRSDRVQGTVAYMSPEQVMGNELDHRSDIFAIGVVLWNALTGKKLFHGASEHATMFNVLKRKVPQPSTLGLRPPAAFDSVIMTALQRDPNKRFQTAEEMAIALREIAISNGCLGAPSEIAEWVATTFGADLEGRRRAIRDVAQSKVMRMDGDHSSLSFTSTLPRLDERSRIEISGDTHDQLSIEDLTRESDEVARMQELLESEISITMHPPPRSGRGMWMTLAVVSAVMTVAVIVWSISSADGTQQPAALAQPVEAAQPTEIELDAIVVNVTSARKPVVAPPEPVAADPEPVKSAATNATTTKKAAKTVVRPAASKAKTPDKQVATEKEPVAEKTLAPPEKLPVPEKPADKPEKSDKPEKPSLESNPYIYK